MSDRRPDPSAPGDVRACRYGRCGHVGADVIDRVACDVAYEFYRGPMCARHAALLRLDALVIVEDLEDVAA